MERKKKKSVRGGRWAEAAPMRVWDGRWKNSCQRGYPSQEALLCSFFTSASWLTLSFVRYCPPPNPSKRNDTFSSFPLEQQGIPLCGSCANTMVHWWSDAWVSQLITMNPSPTGRVEFSWKQLYRLCKWFIHYGGHSIDCLCLLR